MLKALSPSSESEVEYNPDWITQFNEDFNQRFVCLLGHDFRKINCKDVLYIIAKEKVVNMNEKIIYYGKKATQPFTKADLDRLFSVYDIKRLEAYTKNIVDYHVILDLLPQISKLYFNGSISEIINLSLVQCCLLIGLGLQYKHVETVADELNLKVNQILAMFNKTLRRILKFFLELEIDSENKSLPSEITHPEEESEPSESIPEQEFNPGQDRFNRQKVFQTDILQGIASPQFIIQGNDKAWEEAALQLKGQKVPNIISVKRKLSQNDKKPKKSFKKRRPKSSKK
jgi:N-acetyltransferase 10